MRRLPALRRVVPERIIPATMRRRGEPRVGAVSGSGPAVARGGESVLIKTEADDAGAQKAENEPVLNEAQAAKGGSTLAGEGAPGEAPGQ